MWAHDFVQAQFVSLSINRRKLYPVSLRSTLADTYALREIADYRTDHGSEVRARRALRRTQGLVNAVLHGRSDQ